MRGLVKSGSGAQRHVGQMMAWSGLALALVAGLAWGVAGSPAKFVDGLDSPVVPAPSGTVGAERAVRGLVTGIARQADGGRMVAVGSRGRILVSDDGGAQWRQVASPVATDLVAVRFASASTAWAVGHDGVILRSLDAGEAWERMLDGRALSKMLLAAYPEKEGDRLAREIQRGATQSATPGVWPAPFLDILFTDADHGFAVGAFGLIVRTADGGKTWQPWFERTENEKRFHLYALAGHTGQVYVVGEQGLLLRLNTAGDRFDRVETPYNGTYFGIDLLGDQQLLVYGLRGNAYLSTDAGGQWRKLETGSDANLVAATQSRDRVILVSQTGEVMAIPSSGGAVKTLRAPGGAEVFSAVSVAANRMAVVRFNGPAVFDWPANP